MTIVLFSLSLLLPDAPDDRQAKDEEQEDHYFCCSEVDPAGNEGAGTGTSCVKMTEDHVNSCSQVLACPGGFTDSDGTVSCTAPKPK